MRVVIWRKLKVPIKRIYIFYYIIRNKIGWCELNERVITCVYLCVYFLILYTDIFLFLIYINALMRRKRI